MSTHDLVKLFRDAMDWGRYQGQRLNNTEMMYSDVAKGFAEQARAAIRADVPAGQPIAKAYRGGTKQFGYATIITKLPAAKELPLGDTLLYAALPPASEAPAVPSAWIPYEREHEYAGSDWINASRTPKAGWEPLYRLTAPRPEAPHLASSDPEGHRQAISDHEAEPTPSAAVGELQRAVIGRAMLRLYKADPEGAVVIGDLLAYIDTDRAARAKVSLDRKINARGLLEQLIEQAYANGLEDGQDARAAQKKETP